MPIIKAQLNCILWTLGRYAELPLVITGVLVGCFWFGVWIGLPFGFLAGRLLYLIIKYGFNRLMLGSAWPELRAEISQLESEKLILSPNGRAFFKSTPEGRTRAIYFCIGIFIAGLFLELEILLWTSMFFLGILIQVYLASTTPPSVLFLSTSSSRGLSLLKGVKSRIFPFRSISLLDVGALGEIDGLRIPAKLELFDCVRVGKETDWRDVITRLEKVIPIIVLDARENSEAVAWEVDFLHRESLTAKAFLVVGDDDEASALAGNFPRLVSEERPQLTRCTPEKLLTQLVDGLVGKLGRKFSETNKSV